MEGIRRVWEGICPVFRNEKKIVMFWNIDGKNLGARDKWREVSEHYGDRNTEVC
jgi:hypothetical protein